MRDVLDSSLFKNKFEWSGIVNRLPKHNKWPESTGALQPKPILARKTFDGMVFASSHSHFWRSPVALNIVSMWAWFKFSHCNLHFDDWSISDLLSVNFSLVQPMSTPLTTWNERIRSFVSNQFYVICLIFNESNQYCWIWSRVGENKRGERKRCLMRFVANHFSSEDRKARSTNKLKLNMDCGAFNCLRWFTIWSPKADVYNICKM